MTDQPTCGTGLAENSTLPATLGELLGAMARVLDVHRQALDKTDPNTLLEIDAYTTLVTDLGTVSERLSAVARRMAGYRDLPMGRHDMQVMSSREAVEAFAEFVQRERTVLSLMTDRVGQHETMLEQTQSMRSSE